MKLLSQFKKGSRLRIIGLKEELEARSTLTGIGILPGDEIEVLRGSFMGSPLAICFGDNEFVAMRLKQASMIVVEEVV